jgi:hypothetical protein
MLKSKELIEHEKALGPPPSGSTSREELLLTVMFIGLISVILLSRLLSRGMLW